VVKEADENRGEKEQEAKGYGAGGIEQNIAEAANAIGQECLMEFVGACDQEGGGDCKAVGGETVTETASRLALHHAEGPEADEREDSISDEVAGLADDGVDGFPISKLIEAEERLCDVPKGLAGVVGTSPGCGFKGEDEQAGEDG